MSLQEVLVRKLMGNALGRKYMFEPMEYRKGNATREPADLAWYCRDSIVLFYMTETKHGWEYDARHNLTQAKGWMKAWRSGTVLFGKNEDQSFEIPFDETIAKIVISISGDESLDELLEDQQMASIIGVDRCATVSSKFIEYFASLQASISDLANIIILWKDAKEAYPDLKDIELFDYLRSRSMQEAGKNVGWRVEGIPSESLNHATKYIRGMRSVPATLRADSSADIDFNAFFCDFSFVEQFTLLFSLGRAIEKVEAGSKTFQVPIEIYGYKGIVSVVENTQRLVDLEMVDVDDNNFFFTYELSLGAPIFGFRSLRSPTRVWRSLRAPETQPCTDEIAK